MRRTQRGAALLIALGTTAALVAILVAAASTQRVAIQSTRQQLERTRARQVAVAGVQRAVAEIMSQYATAATTGTGTGTTTGTTSNSPNTATLSDDWAKLGDVGSVSFVVGRDSFRLQIIDTASMIDINTAVQGQLERLPLSTEQIDSLLDYRETTTTARATGAKDDYYNNLAKGYSAKLGKFETVDELLQVRGWTGATLYQPNTTFSSTGGQVTGKNGELPVLIDLLTAYAYSPSLNPAGQAKLNVNGPQQAAQFRAQLMAAPIRLPFQLANQISNRKTWTMRDLLALPTAGIAANAKAILNYLQIGGNPRFEGKINLNTVSESTLQSIPQLTSDMVQSILTRQSQGFTALGDIVDIPGFTGTVLQQTADLFAVSSNTFVVRVIGTAGATDVAIEATIDVQNNKAKIVGITEPPLDDMRLRWGWEDETNSETVLMELP